MLTGITDKEIIKNLVIEFGSHLNKYESLKRNAYIAYRQGKYDRVNHEFNVSFNEKYGLWWYLGETDNRYWNCFGIYNSILSKNLNITVEINMPFDGINLRTSGLWAYDGRNNFYLLHNGAIGGGKKDFGKERFKSLFKGEYESVFLNGKVYEYAMVAQLNSKEMIHQISWFVNEIRRIKVSSNEIINQHLSEHNYKPEFFGSKSYNLPLTIEANCNHGIVVDKLQEKLTKKGYIMGNDGLPDLYSYKGGIIDNVFEIKTSLSRQSVYTAIGQLLLNTVSLNNKPFLYFVCPNSLSEDLMNDLGKINIRVIKYDWINDEPVFINLNEFY